MLLINEALYDKLATQLTQPTSVRMKSKYVLYRYKAMNKNVFILKYISKYNILQIMRKSI